MFDTLFSLIGLLVTFVYPLTQSYPVLSTASPTAVQELSNAILSSSSKIPPLLPAHPTTQANARRWMIYWIVLSICLTVQSNVVIKTLVSFIPFNSLVLLYLKIWLVFPIATISSDTPGKQISGSSLLYEYYLLNWLIKLDNYYKNLNFDDSIKMLNNLKNNAIQKYTPNSLQFLKSTSNNNIKSSYLSSPAATSVNSKDISMKEMFNNLWQTSGLFGFYQSAKIEEVESEDTPTTTTNELFPKVLISSLLSPFKSFGTSLEASYEMKSREAEYDMVNREELNNTYVEEIRGATTQPELPISTPIVTIPSDNTMSVSTGTDTDTSVPTATNRRSSWSFGWRRKSSSSSLVDGSEDKSIDKPHF